MINLLTCYDCQITKVTRLYKFTNLLPSEKKRPSLTFKIEFNSSKLPQKVYLDNISFSVRPYNQPPLKCYNCQRFGHMSNGCTQITRCNICSGNHKMQDCASQIKKCANCQGNHVSSSKECRYNRDATEIVKLKSQGASFTEARSIVQAKRKGNTFKYNRNSSHIHQEPSMTPENFSSNYQEIDNRPLYSSVVQGNRARHRQEENQPQPQERPNLNDIKLYVDQAIASTSVKLVGFLQEILTMQLFKESIRGRKQLLLNVAKHHFGNSIDEESLKASLHIDQPEKDIATSEEVNDDEPIIQPRQDLISEEESEDGVLSDKETKSQVIKTKFNPKHPMKPPTKDKNNNITTRGRRSSNRLNNASK